MASTTEKQANPPTNLFDEDITSVYALELPAPMQNAYPLQGVEIVNDNEQYMLDAFHQQYVAIEGRTAIAKQLDTRISEISTHTSLMMGMTIENTARIEAVTPPSRLTKTQYAFNNQVISQAGRYMLETNAITYRTMHEDIRRNIYKPLPPPPQPPRKKGLIPLVFEFLFGG